MRDTATSQSEPQLTPSPATERRGEPAQPSARADLRPGTPLFLQRYAGNAGAQAAGDGLLVQRQCACGGSAAGGECEECKRRRLSAEGGAILQRSPSGLAVSQPGDRFEQEADRTADAVVSGRPLAGLALSSVAGLQRDAAGGGGPAAAPPIVHDVLRSPGQPLDAGTRAFMEPRFGQDFSQVRIHTDARAAESARAVSAKIGRAHV